MTKMPAVTPIRRALREESSLQSSVQNGLSAVKDAHRDYFDASIRTAFADSIDADEALREDHDQENRWDYLLGHESSGQVIAVEPHSAKEDEISTVIRKRKAALAQMKEHLRDGARVEKWLWVASGRVHFADTEKAKVRLDQNGIEFVGTKLLAKHLPPDEPPSSPASTKVRRKARK